MGVAPCFLELTLISSNPRRICINITNITAVYPRWDTTTAEFNGTIIYTVDDSEPWQVKEEYEAVKEVLPHLKFKGLVNTVGG